jgi:hypothetical protein
MRTARWIGVLRSKWNGSAAAAASPGKPSRGRDEATGPGVVASPAQPKLREGMPSGCTGWTIANRAPVASRKPQHELPRAITLCALPVKGSSVNSEWTPGLIPPWNVVLYLISWNESGGNKGLNEQALNKNTKASILPGLE